ncbi:MAG: DUF6544 family protein [Vicinamibacterales bacterium]
MTSLFAVLLALHGLVHLLGAAKAFRWAELPQLTQPISPAAGGLWLAAAGLFLAAAVAIVFQPRWWWIVGAGAVAVSTVVIAMSWADAKAGAAVNVVVALGVLFGFMAQGPLSLRAEFERDVQVRLRGLPSTSEIAEADIAHLPDPVRRYLRRSGVVGRPRVRNYRVRVHGRIRDSRDGRWMPITAEQYNFVEPPARLFYLDASMFGIPVQGYHRYVGDDASMRVKAAALVPVVTESGSEMTRSETVTLFNDMCVMAPATLISSEIAWEASTPRSVRARFTNAGQSIRAELSFNDAGELTNFVSDDRSAASPGNGALTRVRWSTPLRDYREFGPARLASVGEGRWRDAEGEYNYIELTIDDVQYNVR